MYEEYDALRQAGATGEMVGHFLDRGGQLMDTELNERTIGLSFNDLRDCEIVAVVGGVAKLDAIRAWLRSGTLEPDVEYVVGGQLDAAINFVPDTPMMRIKELGGHLLGIGAHVGLVTLYHWIEDSEDSPFEIEWVDAGDCVHRRASAAHKTIVPPTTAVSPATSI